METAASLTLTPNPTTYYRQINQQRFTIELEFLSSLSSPSYLTYLHSLGRFQSPSFLRYLAYIHQTWSQPKYLKYLRYPNAILLCKALVDNSEFRDVIGRDGWEGEMSKQIVRQWAGTQAAGTVALTGDDRPGVVLVQGEEESSREQAVTNTATYVKNEEGKT